MTLHSSIQSKSDLQLLEEFVKLPENKVWLGHVSRFFTHLGKLSTISTPEQLRKESEALLKLADHALTLIRSAEAGSDQGDVSMINRFCQAMSIQFRQKLSPEMSALSLRGTQP